MVSKRLQRKIPEKTTHFKGVYSCPLCGTRKVVSLPYSRDHLELVIRISRNKLLKAPRMLCPNCHRWLWLEKILDRDNHVVLDAFQWIQGELVRLRQM